MELTLITAYYDLTEYEDRPEGKDRNNYMKWAEFLFKLDSNIVFFVSEKDYDYIKKKREENNKLEKTVIIKREYNELQFYNLREEIEEYLKENPIRNSTIKDTKNYIPLTWTKIYLVEEIIKKNPFKTEYFGWIDFGIHGVCHGDMKDIEDYSKCLKLYNKIRIMELRHIIESEISDLKEYTSLFRWKIAGGLWTGHYIYLKKFIDYFKHYMYILLSNRIVSHEEGIFGIIYYKHNEIFEPYYGNYWQILANYDKLRILDDVILWNITHTRQNNLLKESYNIIERVYLDKLEDLNIIQLIKILNEIIISGYYINKTDTTIYTKNIIKRIMTYSKEIISENIKSYKELILNNIKYYEYIDKDFLDILNI